ncbi:23S rRNA m(6)A-1618 methyltransferase [Formosa sp. Hel1_31_208]|uniref:23S rRNA (adenine(1618)-N(6))-methyltransferase RlmF n=1 Tax=Formosa sp. Hel1_31_208 TaxID=1798225 RepID=UPI00087D9E6A|nr:23S rRNA (adenine(1618)-N(6))-methyltransferase RlmF [Formosa sp. Hel1_31_208]SDS16657.1 23S rRNA m(6)A-1618 methyltransferase [Formosa sp. Hel1_31_208]
MHKRNKHRDGYDFPALATTYAELEDYMFHNNFGNLSIDFANPKAVKALNTALLKHHYGITYWEFPDAHLCPPIPGRVEYIHLIQDLLSDIGISKAVTVLDIGTGATCIYPILGHAEYNWHFIASEIDQQAFKNAQKIIAKNKLEKGIELRFQKDAQDILTGILNPSEQITVAICNPPFFKNETEAIAATTRKLKGLQKDVDGLVRNFSGTAKELCYLGGEKAFLHNYLYQSSLLKSNCIWYTSLVSKKEHINSMRTSLDKLGAKKVKVLELSLGNKISRVVAWTFLSDQALQNFKKEK